MNSPIRMEDSNTVTILIRTPPPPHTKNWHYRICDCLLEFLSLEHYTPLHSRSTESIKLATYVVKKASITHDTHSVPAPVVYKKYYIICVYFRAG